MASVNGVQPSQAVKHALTSSKSLAVSQLGITQVIKYKLSVKAQINAEPAG